MSLILDALRQSKQQVGHVSTDETLSTGSSPQTAKRTFGIAALSVGMMLGAGAVTLWQWGFVQVSGRGEAEIDPSASPVVDIPPEGYVSLRTDPGSLSASAEASPRLSRPSILIAEPSRNLREEPQVTTNERGRITDNGQIASLHQQMWADAESGGSAAMTTPNARPAAVRGRSDAPGQQARESPSIAPPIDFAKAMENAAREIGESALSPHPTPLLENLSQQQKDQIPTIVYSEHDYASQGMASVTLNGKRLRSGQRADTVEVIEILIDSVILRVRGVEFRLKALNTWLNL